MTTSEKWVCITCRAPEFTEAEIATFAAGCPRCGARKFLLVADLEKGDALIRETLAAHESRHARGKT